MGSKQVACGALLLAMLASRAVGKPFEIIFREMDEPCPQKQYTSAPVRAQQPYTQPQYRTLREGDKVKYIMDYQVRLPCTPKKPKCPSQENSLGSTNSILLIEEPPNVVRNRCTCKSPSVLRDGIIVTCPLHSQQPNILQPSDFSSFLMTSNRAKRDAPKKKAFWKKHIFGKGMRSEKSKQLGKHSIHKREAAQPVKRQTSFQLKKQYKYPDVVQYFPEVLSSNYKPGECFTCCSTQKKGELVCQPSGAGVQYTEQTSPKSSPYRVGYAIPASTVVDSNYYPDDGQGRLVEIVEDEESATDQAYHEFIKSVIHSHGDFFEASGTQKGLIKSADVQRAEAHDLIRRLLKDELAHKKEELSHPESRYTRDYRSPRLERVPQDKPNNMDSILVKLAPPPGPAGQVPPK